MMIYLQMIETSEDKSNFEKIYCKYKNLMLYIANDLLHNREDAEDVVHQAFVSIAENISKIDFSDEGKVKSLVVTIVENKAIDLLRKRTNVVAFEEDGIYKGIVVDYDGGNLLADCILRLPVRYREIIILKYWHGYSIKEISKILGLSIYNTAKIDQRAKKKLEQLCKEVGVL